MSSATISRPSDAFEVDEVYRIIEIVRSGAGAKAYASVTDAAANIAPEVPPVLDDPDGLHVVADLAMPFDEAVALGRELQADIPDDLVDLDLGPEG